MRLRLFTFAVLFLCAFNQSSQGRQLRGSKPNSDICAACVHADLGFLASDELHGRGSGTRDEHLAALYAASLFQSFGLEPAGDGGYIQRAPLPNPLPERVQGYLKKLGLDQNQRTDTWNALGLLRGSDA